MADLKDKIPFLQDKTVLNLIFLIKFFELAY
jgi:hypothetical protein